jgi:hypothetical protein
VRLVDRVGHVGEDYFGWRRLFQGSCRLHDCFARPCAGRRADITWQYMLAKKLGSLQKIEDSHRVCVIFRCMCDRWSHALRHYINQLGKQNILPNTLNESHTYVPPSNIIILLDHHYYWLFPSHICIRLLSFAITVRLTFC